VIGFAYRESIYLSAAVIFLYVFNTDRDALPARTVFFLLSIFWLVVVAGGFLGLAFPHVSFEGPVARLIPEGLLSNQFVSEMVHPAFAQEQDFLGYVTPRPSAPFVYTNDWGGCVALMVPLMIAAWSSGIGRRLRGVIAVSLAVAIIPVALSLNRGLWLSLAVGFIYAAVRMAIRGRERPLLWIIVIFGLIAGAVLLSPLRHVVDDRLATPHSNSRRLSLTEEALAGVSESPIIGFGAPRPSEWNPNAPSVGTQGVIWLVLFSHGIPGTLLFIGWFGYGFWALRRARDPIGFWVHVMLLVFMLQWFVYDLPPATLAIAMIGMALAARDGQWRAGGVHAGRSPTREAFAEPAAVRADR
jgi:hypothetical protein